MRHAQPFPVLTTERLELLAVQSRDGTFYHQLLSVAEVTRFSDLPDRATRAQADRFVDWMSKLYIIQQRQGLRLDDPEAERRYAAWSDPYQSDP